MKVKTAKLAQAIHGEQSLQISEDKYNLTFDKGILTVAMKGPNPRNLGPFMIFPANIAYIVPAEGELEAAAADKKPLR